MSPEIATFLPEQIARDHSLRRGSGRWSGACPKCGGGPRSDKFVLRDDGGFKCYGCDFKGDVITWLRDIEGMTCADAHDRAGQACRATSCPASGTCRLGSGEAQARPRRRAVTLTPRRHAGHAATVATLAATRPRPEWLAWAEPLVATATETLLARPEELAWLAGRGITIEAVRRHRLGWLGHDRRVPRATLALPPREGKDKLWVPGGLLIPTTAAGALVRIRVRRSPEDRARLLPDLKYVWIEGSGNSPMVIGPAGSPRGAVIVEAELDAIAVAAACPDVLVVAVGTVRGGVPAELRAALAAAPVVLVALDADPDRDGHQGAGPQAVAAWCASFRQARFLPVPSGKDAGEYAQAGGDLAAWIESSLPPIVTVAAPPQSATPEPPSSLTAGAGGGEGVAPDGDAEVSFSSWVDLLEQAEGWIERQRPELFVRFRRWPATAEEAAQRNHIVWIAYGVRGGGHIAALLNLLPDGSYGHGSLRQFFRGA